MTGVTLRRPAAFPARLLLALLACTALIVACGGEDPKPQASPSPTPSPTPSQTPPPPPPPPPPNPLTGVVPAPTAALVAVKIDNAPLARPFHRGLDAASLVYLELVEGGATRMMALYSEPPGTDVGPIRSFRESDIELLVQHGPIGVGFSGANGGVLRSFQQAVAAGELVDVSYDSKPQLYRIGERRRDAKNFYAVPASLSQAAAGAVPAQDIGLVFDPAPRPGAAPGGTATVVFSDRESAELRYDPATGRYAVVQAGTPLTGAAPANVIVQQVPVRASQYKDVTGAVTPYTTSVGSGPAHVLRDGVLVSGQWQRPDAASGTRYLDPAGAPIALKPGPTWILLQPVGLPFSAS